MKATEVLWSLSDKCRRVHLSYATEKSCAHWAESYSRSVVKMRKLWTSERKAEAFLTSLARREVAAATFKAWFSAGPPCGAGLASY